MAGHFSACGRAHLRAALLCPLPPLRKKILFSVLTAAPSERRVTRTERRSRRRSTGVRVSNGGDSYLDMWKNASDRERKAMEFQRIAENSVTARNDDDDGEESPEVLERKSHEFNKLLEVPKEERDRVQRMQVIDRAAAAIAAARALIKDSPPPIDAGSSVDSGSSGFDFSKTDSNETEEGILEGGVSCV